MTERQQIGKPAERETLAAGRSGTVCCFAALLLCCFASGCLERTITITSKPEGAIVWLNDTEVGRTPVTTAFTFYGDYDVRLRKEGYEPLSTHRVAGTPIYEYAPIDLVATALPVRIKTDLKWDFELTALPDPKAGQGGLIQRAREMQAESTKK